MILTVTEALNGAFTDVTATSGAVAVILVDEIHFFVPKSELDSMGADLTKLKYRVSAFAHDGDYVTNWSGGVFPLDGARADGAVVSLRPSPIAARLHSDPEHGQPSS